LVQFVGGDINSAVVTGRLYNDDDRPPVAKEREYVYISPHDKESGVRRVYLEFPNGNTLELNDDEMNVLFQMLDIVSLISVGQKKNEEEANSLIKIK